MNENDSILENTEEFTAPAAPAAPSKALGIVSLILGALSLVSQFCCSCIPMVGGCLSSLAPIFAIVGIVLACIQMSKAKKAGIKDVMAIIGLILSIVGLVASIIASIILICTYGLSFFTGILGGMADSGYSDYYYYY